MILRKWQPTVCVDFDGTICEHRYPDVGQLMPGVREALLRFRDLGFRIIISSCRTCHWNYEVFGGNPEDSVMMRQPVRDMCDFLLQHDIPFDEIDFGDKGKVMADFYIDDKAVRFTNWHDVTQFIEGKAIQV